jgi:hypothetical protein
MLLSLRRSTHQFLLIDISKYPLRLSAPSAWLRSGLGYT